MENMHNIRLTYDFFSFKFYFEHVYDEFLHNIIDIKHIHLVFNVSMGDIWFRKICFFFIYQQGSEKLSL